MSHTRSKSKRLFSSENIAGSSTATFNIGDKKYVGIQIAITEACLCVASIPDECITLGTNLYTEASHGYVTGLKGVLAAVIGCATTTPAACVAVCACRLTITEACHGYTKGERGQFTTSCADLPAGLCLATNYYVTSVAASTYQVSSTRALAIACCSDVAVTDAGTGCHTFTPNGAIPTGSTANSWIIKVDDCSFKLATSKVNAEAGTVDAISALNAPAAVTFTAACADACSGTVTIKYSNSDGPCATYLVDAGVGLLGTPGTISCAGLSVIDAELNAIPYQSIQVDVDVIDSQWVTTIDINAKD